MDDGDAPVGGVGGVAPAAVPGGAAAQSAAGQPRAVGAHTTAQEQQAAGPSNGGARRSDRMRKPVTFADGTIFEPGKAGSEDSGIQDVPAEGARATGRQRRQTARYESEGGTSFGLAAAAIEIPLSLEQARGMPCATKRGWWQRDAASGRGKTT